MSAPQTQREYWSGKVGDEWAARADRIDAMLVGVADAAIQRAAFKAGEAVLDIGCGAGATTLAIARAVAPGGTVLGVDLSPQLLSVARARAGAEPAADFLEADAGAADLGRRFDVAFSRFGVMFFEAPTQAFAHIRAHMSGAGRLVFACWRPLKENIWATTPVEAILPMLKAPLPAPDPDAPGPFSLADDAKIARILAAAGWREIAVAPWDGDILIGGGGALEESAEFLMRIGPCARAIADQELDAGEAKRRVMERLAPLHEGKGVALAAACWIVTARA